MTGDYWLGAREYLYQNSSLYISRQPSQFVEANQIKNYHEQ